MGITGDIELTLRLGDAPAGGGGGRLLSTLKPGDDRSRSCLALLSDRSFARRFFSS